MILTEAYSVYIALNLVKLFVALILLGTSAGYGYVFTAHYAFALPSAPRWDAGGAFV